MLTQQLQEPVIESAQEDKIYTKYRNQYKNKNKTKLNTCSQSKHLHIRRRCPQGRQCFLPKICMSFAAMTHLDEGLCHSELLMLKVKNFPYLNTSSVHDGMASDCALENINKK
jgi:hypothetical protein